MKGALELTRQFYAETVDPALQHEFPELYPRLAAGLVGNGSECYGFDDELSQDHDWGVDFYIWVTEQDRAALPVLTDFKARIMAQCPLVVAEKSPWYLPLTPMTIGEFYARLIGVPREPETLGEWTRPPEEHFSLAVNGEVFYDGAGAFSQIRSDLLRYYPEDIRRKRMAAACMKLAQTGQYNYMRMAKRDDWVAAQLSLAHFIETAAQLAFMLNKVYRPYYKWLYRGMCDLPLLGSELAEPLSKLALAPQSYSLPASCSCAAPLFPTLEPSFDPDVLTSREQDIATACELLTAEIHRQGLAHSPDSFLIAQGEEIQQSIRTEALRNLPAQYEL